MFIMENNEKIKLMNNLGQENLEFITYLLLRGCSYDEISKLTGVDTLLIEQVFRIFLPEQYNEKIELMNSIGKERLEIVKKLLCKCSYDTISELTGVDTLLIEEVFRVFLPEKYKAIQESKDSIVEVLQAVNKGKSR